MYCPKCKNKLTVKLALLKVDQDIDVKHLSTMTLFSKALGLATQPPRSKP
jgi:hypothetical protein